MKIFKFIELGNPGPKCRGCIHFQSDPALIEATYPGLTTMSSGYASVRDEDGICNRHQLYLSARDSCPQFVSRASGLNDTKTAISEKATI